MKEKPTAYQSTQKISDEFVGFSTDKESPERIAKMNDHARRVWEGQSPSLSVLERVGRVRQAVIGQGYHDIIRFLELPEPQYNKYL